MRRRAFVWMFAALVLALFSAGCSQTFFASAKRYRTDRLEKYRKPIDPETLQPGDRIQVLLHAREQQTIPATIDDRGCVTLPYIDSIKIGGLSTGKAEELIKREYVRRKIYNEGSIQVGIQTTDRMCTVQGHVIRPGPCQFSRSITINMAISMAGGPDPYAHAWKTDLTRGGKKQRINRQKDGDVILVEPGDIIDVVRGDW